MTAKPITRKPEAWRKFSGNRVSSPVVSDWTNNGGPGSPRRRFGYFAAEGKVTRAGARNNLKQPKILIKRSSEDVSSDKNPRRRPPAKETRKDHSL